MEKGLLMRQAKKSRHSVFNITSLLPENTAGYSENKPVPPYYKKIESNYQSSLHKIEQLKCKIELLKKYILDICEFVNMKAPDFRCNLVFDPNECFKNDDGDTFSEEGDSEEKNEIYILLPFQQIILNNFLSNSIRKPNGRRYSDTTISFFASLKLQIGEPNYNYLKNALPYIPSVTTIQRWFKPYFVSIKDNITNIEKIPELINIWRNTNDLPQNELIFATLALDAASTPNLKIKKEVFQNTLIDKNSIEKFISKLNKPIDFEDFDTLPDLLPPPEKPKNYMFVYYLQPIQNTMSCTPVHVLHHENGNATDEIMKRLEIINEILLSANIKILNYSVDGDNKYYSMTIKSFELFQDVLSFQFFNIAELMYNETPIIADMLHIIKNARTRLLNGDISLNFVDSSNSFSAQLPHNIVPVPEQTWNNSQVSKMYDFFPLILFNLDNCAILLDEAEKERNATIVHCSLYFILFSMLQESFRNENLRRKERQEMLYTIANICDLYITYFEDAKSSFDYLASGQNHSTEKPACLFSMIGLKRIYVTCMVCCLLIDSNIQINLDRISSHPLENFFGLLRMICGYKHNSSNCLNAIVKTIIVKQIKHNLSINGKIKKRLNVAGVMLEEENGQEDFPDLDIEKTRFIAQNFIYLIDQSYGNEAYGLPEGNYDCSFELIKNWISSYPRSTEKARIPGPYSGDQILSHLYAVEKKPSLKL